MEPQIPQPLPETKAPALTDKIKLWFRADKKRYGLIFLPLILILIGVYFIVSGSTLPGSQNSGKLNDSFDLDLSEGVFAKYEEVKSMVKPSLKAYTLSSGELSNLREVQVDAKLAFNPSALTRLEQTGFFIQPSKPVIQDIDTPIGFGSRIDDMVDLYDQFQGDLPKEKRKPENAVFITSDFLLHIYHVLLDRSFQKIEANTFQPRLKKLTTALFEDSLQRYKSESDPKLKESLKRLTAFYLVPKILLESSVDILDPNTTLPTAEPGVTLFDEENVDTPENIKARVDFLADTVPDEILQLVRAEINLVADASSVAPSPLYSPLKPDFTDDYTQYKPRSHYTKNSLLRSYFRAMIWYGRHGFDTKNQDLVRDSLVMSWQLGAVNVENQKAAKLWESIYLPTVFFVGKSDDLSIYEYKAVIEAVYGKNVSYKNLSDSTKLEKFQAEVQKLPGPKILSEVRSIDPGNAPTKEELLLKTKGFRFMGQRFIPDSYILSSLTQGDEQPDVETKQLLPSTPTALMVMSVLGSKTADAELSTWIKDQAPDSDKVIAKFKTLLTEEFKKLDTKTWTQNIYWSWLYNLLPLLEPHGEGYPSFMQNEAWNKKDLNTALGSWTELRHDTLLYAKPTYAELGGGGPEGEIPPVPKGYVEPNLNFLTRLIALNNMTIRGLNSFELIDEAQKSRFDTFDKSLNFYKEIAEKQLSNQVISDDEYEDLRTSVGREITHLLDPYNGEELTEKDARAALIADIHTDAKKNQILYEATGIPFIIYVAVKDQGGTRLTRGVTYSYFEFTEALGDRLTDEAWQERLYKTSPQTPILPSFVNELTVK